LSFRCERYEQRIENVILGVPKFLVQIGTVA
jgi:hypothetical protein